MVFPRAAKGACMYTHTHTHTHTERERERERERQTDRQTDKQARRQTDGQTDNNGRPEWLPKLSRQDMCTSGWPPVDAKMCIAYE